jgi:Bacterial regulatory helix-turn-helix protein, lysR family
LKSKIHGANFQRLDFRLLELFSAVMRLRCVTDAALALDMPQASASHGIARLREMHGDFDPTVAERTFVIAASDASDTFSLSPSCWMQ